jgi:hypothetical protein
LERLPKENRLTGLPDGFREPSGEEMIRRFIAMREDKFDETLGIPDSRIHEAVGELLSEKLLKACRAGFGRNDGCVPKDVLSHFFCV